MTNNLKAQSATMILPSNIRIDLNTYSEVRRFCLKNKFRKFINYLIVNRKGEELFAKYRVENINILEKNIEESSINQEVLVKSESVSQEQVGTSTNIYENHQKVKRYRIKLDKFQESQTAKLAIADSSSNFAVADKTSIEKQRKNHKKRKNKNNMLKKSKKKRLLITDSDYSSPEVYKATIPSTSQDIPIESKSINSDQHEILLSTNEENQLSDNKDNLEAIADTLLILNQGLD